MYYKTLENIDLNTICTAFNEAFSDYQVSTNISLKQFEIMLKRRGFNAKLSIGAFDNNQLVGFVLNGLRIWNNQLTIYDLGTAVIPSYRKQGITSQILKMVHDICKENNIEYYLLEVIKDNTNALALYQKQGFVVTRSFDCFNFSKDDLVLKENKDITINYLEKLDKTQWEIIQNFWQYLPSWQNSMDSINAVSNEFDYILASINNEIIGYAIFEKGNGGIVQLAVSQNYRRQYIASTILKSYSTKYDIKKFSMINVDSKNKDLCAFLKHLGFEIFVSQYEMIKPIK